MDKFIQIVLGSNNKLTPQLDDLIRQKNITTVQELIILLKSSFFQTLTEKSKSLIHLYQHIKDSNSKSEQQATIILSDLKNKYGVFSIQDLQQMTDQEASELGITIDSNELISILQNEIEIDENMIEDVLYKLKLNGINTRQRLVQFPVDKSYPQLGIPKYSFQAWVQKNSQGQLNNCFIQQQSIQIQVFEEKEKRRKFYLEKLTKDCQKLGVKYQNDQYFTQYLYHDQVFIKDQSYLKTLVVIGETGVGKSTFINFLSNFYIGVQYEDPFRFIVVNEPQSQSAVSQTKEVTEYFVKGFDRKFALRIIDTPGFGDTKGYLEDEKISKLITTKLEELDSINLIGFVIKAATTRLTLAQKYIMNRILQLFGKDVIQNFIFLLTFSDGSKPKALSAIEFLGDSMHTESPVANLVSQVRQPYWIAFNNSAFQDESPMKCFWDAGYQQFETFYGERILKTDFVTLTLTKEVINERKQIQNLIQVLRYEVQKKLNLINEISEHKKIIINLTKEQEQSKNFKFSQTVYNIKKVNLGRNEYVTNCNNCNTTCHYPCFVVNKQKCIVMKDDFCTVCANKQNKCHYSDHDNMDFYFATEETIKEVVMEDLQRRYQTSSKEKLTKEGLLKNMDLDLQNNKTTCQVLITSLMKSVNRLNEIALQPAISDVQTDYVQHLIKVEEQTQSQGYDKRIQILKTIYKDFELLKQQIKQQENI